MTLDEDMFPIAGGAALGLLALGGAGLIARRRRRRRENEEFEARQQALDRIEEEEPVLELDRTQEVRPAPGFARVHAPIHDPIPAIAPAAELPEGFDASRFGRHVQAAYQGPTPDNPSVSLEYRLRKAAFLDDQERKASELAGADHPTAAPAKIPDRGNWESSDNSDFLFRRPGKDAKQSVEQD